MFKWITNKLKSDFFKVYFFDMIAKLFTVLISIFIIRSLTENDYAKYTLFSSIGSFIAGVLGSGMGLAYTRYAVILREKKQGEDACLFKSLRRRIIMLAIGGLIISTIVLLVTGKINYIYILGIIYGLILALYQLNVVFFQARERYSVGGMVSNVKNIVVAVAIFIIFMMPTRKQAYTVVLVYSIAIIISWVVTTCYVNKSLSKYSNVTHNDQYLKSMFKESLWIILYMFMLSAFNQLDVLLLNFFRTPLDVAYYGVAHKYYANVLSLLPALQVVLRVKNSSVEMAKSPILRRKSVVSWVKKSSPLAIGLYIVGFIGAQIFFPILNGHEYDAAIITFNILLIGACLSYVTAPNVSVMLAAGKQRTLFFLSIGSFLINLVGNILFIPQYGANAAAVTTIFAHFFLNGGSTIILMLNDKNTEINI